MTDFVNYAAVTPRTGMPMLFAGQSQKETTVNEAFAIIDILCGGGVQGIRNDPPSSPVAGEVWIVGTSPAGDFTGQSAALAGWTEGGWRFVQPREGMRVHDIATGGTRVFNIGWVAAEAPSTPAGGALIDAEARAAIAGIIQALKVIGIFSDAA